MATPEVLRREQKGFTGSGLIERCKNSGRVYSTARLRTVFLSCRSSVSRHLALPDLRQPALLREIGLRRRGAEQCTRLGLVVGDRGHGEVGVP